MPATIPVHIDDDPLGGIYIDREPVHIDDSTEIEWEYVGKKAGAFTVLFGNESPFPDKVFHSQAKKAKSKKTRPGAQKGKTYKYFVMTDTGDVIDPGVIVH